MVYPINTAGMLFYEIESIVVNEWHELPDGRGDPSEVHIVVKVKGAKYPLIMRFKKPRPIDDLIVALITHRRRVWPSKDVTEKPLQGAD